MAEVIMATMNPVCSRFLSSLQEPWLIQDNGYYTYESEEIYSQEFENFLVVHLETNLNFEPSIYPREIIDLAVMVVDGTSGNLKTYFYTHVRPTLTPKLSNFCTMYTGVQQYQVDEAMALDMVLFRLDQWLEEIGVKRSKFAVVSWANSPLKKSLDSECHFKHISKPFYLNRWIDLKDSFFTNFDIRCNIETAMQLLGLKRAENQPWSFSNAWNITNLLSFLVHCGIPISLTDSLNIYTIEGHSNDRGVIEDGVQSFDFEDIPDEEIVPYPIQPQEFEYFVVIDFEATCDRDQNPFPQEIIEFPAVVVSSQTTQIEKTFQTYVRPTHHPCLTEFCKELTGISQSQVDQGVTLEQALVLHDQWLEEIGIKGSTFAVVTWTNWDCEVFLESECRFKNISKPSYFDRWINLKDPFYTTFGTRCNLKKAVELAGLEWEGRAHCGLDDARNTANILISLLRQGFQFSITNSL